MVRLLDSPGDRDVLAPMIEREILWRLITGPLGQSVRQIGLADSSLTHVSRAVRWISEHYDKPFRVEDLARSCGMSTSAFHRNFHAVTALSPIQFQKQIRLQKSRLLLAHRGGRRRHRRIPRGLRQRLAVQPRVPAPVRASARAATRTVCAPARPKARRARAARSSTTCPTRATAWWPRSRPDGPAALRGRVQQAAVAVGVLAQPLPEALRRAVEEALHAVADRSRSPAPMAA